MKRKNKRRLNFSLLISLICLLFTVLLWDHYFNSDYPFDQLIASNLILLMGSLFSVMVGFFVWSLESNLRQSEKQIKLEKRLFQAEQMKAVGRLAAGIAHDFNNLLLVVTGYSELMLEGLEKKDPRHEEIKRIRELSARGSHLTQQLLALSGRQITQPKVINLNHLILNTDMLFREFLGEQIELVTLPAEKLGMVKVDPGQIEQVLMNLMVNAKDAMPQGGKIILQTSEEDLRSSKQLGEGSELKAGNYISLTVQDTGCGIRPEIQSHIFEPYFTTKGHEKGTGLGLATCYAIIKQSQGYLSVESQQGKGTSFKIYLPHVKGKEDLAGQPLQVKNLPRGSERILVVEDDLLVRKATAQMLLRQGYDVLEAAYGHEALKVAKKEKKEGRTLDLLFTDMMMPYMSGQEVAKHIKEMFPSIKVIFVSGYSGPLEGREGPPLSEGLFLQKPFTRKVLSMKIREALVRSVPVPQVPSS